MAALPLLAEFLTSLFLIGCLAQDVRVSLPQSLLAPNRKPLQTFGSEIWQPALKQIPVFMLEFLFPFFPCCVLVLSLDSLKPSNLSRV